MSSSELLVEVFPTGPIQANCILLGDRSAGDLVVIDPGDEGQRIARRVAATGLAVKAILHTHGHLDHAAGTRELLALVGPVPVALHRDELPLYQSLPMQGQMFGFAVAQPPEPDLWLVHGQVIEVGSLRLEVRHTPGHSPGGVSFVVLDHDLVVVGDVLFAGSVGRTDLWGGSFELLARSIREQLYTLPDHTRVITGHGPDTTIGAERRSNPFVSG